MKNPVLAAACLLALGLSTSAQANLVANGGFEEGTTCGPTPGWTGNGALANNNANLCVVTPVIGAHSGEWYAGFGAVDQLDFISQDVTTVAGQNYSFSFWLAGDLGTPHQFTASLDGMELFNETTIPGNTYALHRFTFMALDNQTTISFGGRNDPGWLRLDDVSLESASSVPEPGSIALFGIAMAGWGAARRRKTA